MKYKIYFEARNGSNTAKSEFEIESESPPKPTDTSLIELAMKNTPTLSSLDSVGITITSIIKLT